MLVLTLWPAGDAGRIELVHVNVADHDIQGVIENRTKYYWDPWRRYLQGGLTSNLVRPRTEPLHVPPAGEKRRS